MKKEYIIYKLSDASKEACKIDNELFPMYNVKRGLRNEDGTGVLVGLTKVGNVVGWLVAMGILSDEAGDICLSRFQFECEQRIKLVQERSLAAKETDESRNIMLHMPSILPGTLQDRKSVV